MAELPCSPNGVRPRTNAIRGAMLALLALLGASGAAASELTVADRSIPPGVRTHVQLTVGEDVLGSPAAIDVAVVRGTRPGKTLCLVGGIHGDELNGMQIVRETVESLDPDDLTGSVIGVPLVNIYGFRSLSRYLPDRRDLNRYFPGSTTGSIAARLAQRLWIGVIVRCDALIDFHTAAQGRENVSQVRGNLLEREVRAMAEAFGTQALIHNPGVPGTLRRAANDRRIPALLYEAGQAHRFERAAIDLGIAGTRGVMAHLGIVEPSDPPTARTEASFYRETHWVRATHGGIVELLVDLGEEIAAGDVVAIVGTPLERRRVEVRTRWSGRVIGIDRNPMAIPGGALLHVGTIGGTIDASETDQELDVGRPE